MQNIMKKEALPSLAQRVGQQRARQGPASTTLIGTRTQKKKHDTSSETKFCLGRLTISLYRSSPEISSNSL